MSSAAHPACDRGIASASEHAGAASPNPTLVLATTILASSLAFIDGSVVNVGLPAIGHNLHAGGAGLSWVVNGYLLPLGALLLIGGALGDRYGRSRALVSGTLLFAIASIVCAAAPNLPALIAGRILQGTGAAILMPNSLAILGNTFAGEARGRAIGIWAAVGAAGGAIGPLIGGWLIDAVGWRAVFLINLPIALAAIALALRYVPDQPTDPTAAPKLDIPGAALVAAGLAAFTYGLTVAAAHGLTTPAAVTLIAGTLLLAAFVLVEHRTGATAMLPLALFADRGFVGLTILTLLLYGALGGLLVLVPYVLIVARGYSATQAGAALLPLPLVIAATSSQMGRLAARIGPRLPLTIGPIVVAIGCLLATSIATGGSYWTTVLPSMLVIALGMAGAVAPLTTAVLAAADPQHTGVASGFNSAVARTGGLIATALASVVLAAPDSFRTAALCGPVAALAAGASAQLVGRRARGSAPGPR